MPERAIGLQRLEKTRCCLTIEWTGPRRLSAFLYSGMLLMFFVLSKPSQYDATADLRCLEISRPPLMGSYASTGLDPSVCYDGRSRYRPYGFIDEDVQLLGASDVQWADLDWGLLQRQCLMQNNDRYEDVEPANETLILRYPVQEDFDHVDEDIYFPDDHDRRVRAVKGPKYKKRSAIVFQIEASSGDWTIDTKQYLRSLIMEMSLHTGGEYELLLLVFVKDDDGPIFNNMGVHANVMGHSVPREFRNCAVLLNGRLLKQWYPKTYQHE